MARQRQVFPPKGCDFIYALVCPLDGLVKYVGKTSLPLRVRLRTHLATSKLAKDSNRPLAEWKLGLLAQGLEPTMLLLETSDDGYVAEAMWTQNFHALNPLFNIRNVHYSKHLV